MKLGIPQALSYYWYYPMWKAFLENLGFEIITSGPTNRKLVNEGCKAAVDETCLPVKTFIGHSLQLLEKADALFIPSLKSCEEKRYFCPKIIALPETTACNVKIPIYSFVINNYSSLKNSEMSYKEFAKRFGISNSRASAAFCKALKFQSIYEHFLREGYTPSQALKLLKLEEEHYFLDDKNKKLHYKIAVLGSPYLVYDSFLNLNIKKKLELLDAEMITADILTEKDISTHTSFLGKDLFWTYPRRLIAGASYFIKHNIDGIILLSSFGCGSDAIMEPFIAGLCENYVPYMVLTIDEHTGEAGFITRLEAFLEMIKHKKRSYNYESCISLHG